MNYGDHNIVEIAQQTKLRVAFVVSSQSSSTLLSESIDSLDSRVRRASRAVLFDKVDTAKMHGLDTSNVPSRVEPSGILAFGPM